MCMFSVIPFTLPGFAVEQVHRQPDVTVIHARATRSVANCPICQQPATRVHSQYRRTPQDLPMCEDRCVWCCILGASSAIIRSVHDGHLWSVIPSGSPTVPSAPCA